MAGRIKGILDFVSETIKDAKYDRAEFDPRFYPGGKLRVKDAPEYRANVIDTGTMIPQERLALQDLEGRPYFTTMSDRTAAGGLLEGIGNKPLAHPIRLTGGQDYMRDDTGELWASGAGVVPNMVKAAKELEDQYGSSPVFMPWRMAPSGGDFAHMTGQTMLSWAAGNMPKVYKKQLDADMKKFVPDWAGIDDPKSLEQYGALPDTQRKSAMNMLDVEYRNKGGISQTQARLAVSDQSQLLSPVSGFQNVGEVNLKRGVLEGAGNATYPSVLAGKYFGTLDTDVTAMDLNPERYARALKKDGTFATGPQGPDSLDTRAAPRRAMEVANWGGLIDEPLLRSLSEKGFKINSGVIPGIATALVGASSLYSSDSDAGVVSSTLNAARKIGDDYTSLLDSAAAKQPMDSAILPGQGGQTFVKPDQEATARMYDEFRNQINSVGENVFDSSPISGAIEIGGREGVKGISRYTFPREYAGETSKIGVDSPDIIEFASDETGARLFREKLMEGKDASKYGSSVTAYDADEYKGMRLFLSEDGSTGYALKPDGDIVSAFSAGKYEGVGPHLIMHGIEQGGKKLDAFDTVLPDLYAQMGFKEAARVKFDPAEAPDDWNMLTYKKFNEGQPDISLMSLDDAPATPVSPNMVDDYGTALDLQSKSLTSQAAPVATAGLLGAGVLGSEDADASMVGLLSKFGASRADLKGMADKMLDGGASPDEIWAKTGWEYNEADKLWRTELPNSKSELNLPSPGKDQKARAKLGDIINDPELLSQYDDRNRLEAGLIFDETEEYGSPIGGPRRFTPLSDIPVIIDNNLPVGYGFHAPASSQAGESIRISGQGTPESQRATLLHEMQHSIQDREGFASGGSEEYFKSNRQATNKWSELYGPRLQDLQDKRLKNEDEIDEMMGLEGLKSSITRDYADSQQGLLSPEQMYRNLVGEVEAENVVTRDSLTPDDLRIKRPGSTEQLSSSDILGRDQQIVRMGSYDPIDQEVGLLTNRRSPEYTEAPVIDEQSFGSMIQEYGDINRRAKAADDQKFGLLMADRSDRAGMSRRDRRGSPASPELQEFTRANALPSLLQFASGVGEGGVDYLKDTFSGGGYVTAPAYASQQYQDINQGLMMAPEEARAPLRADQIYLDPRMAEEAERLNAAGRGFAGILSMFSPI